MKPVIRVKRVETQRIDALSAIRPMSYNVPGHEGRMQALCEKVQREYFDKGLNNDRRPKKA